MRKVISIFLLFIILLSGCKSTKFVPKNEYLLDKVVIELDNKDIKPNEIKPYVQQKTNIKILGVARFKLFLYNLSSHKRDGWISRTLRKGGEAPVIYAESSTAKSEIEIRRYMANKGFTNAEIETIVKTKEKRQKAEVTYKITSNTPYKIAESQNLIQDTTIAQLVAADSSKTLRKNGNLFDLDVLDAERENFSELLKKNGYYNFNKENFVFSVDTTLGDHKAKNTLILNIDTTNPQHSYQQYHIRNIQFVVGYDAQKALKEANTYWNNMDSVWFKNILFLSEGKSQIKPEILFRNNLLKPGMLYNKSISDRTHALLSSIEIIRYVNINYKEISDSILDCSIYISVGKPQVFRAELESTNVSGNFGGAVSLGYGHNNLFRGAEIFTADFTIGKEAIVGIGDADVSSSDELNVDLNLTFPKFVFPFLKEDFKQKSRAKTNFGLSFDYQKRPEFTRNIATADMAYNWQTNRHIRHQLTPIMLNYISIPKISDSFSALIDTTQYLKYSYQDHVIFGSRYAFSFQNNYKGHTSHSRFLWLSLESSGNAVNAFNHIFDSPKEIITDDRTISINDSYYKFLNVRYSQYIKFDATGGVSHYINKSNTIAYRVHFGIGLPYENSKQLPFEKRYFGGGANGVRAWLVRSLGPGTYLNEEVDYYNQSGDINFLASLEYRFKLFWILEGALFADAGNTWTIRDYDEQPGAVFKFNSFYEQLAGGVGLGARFDLNFFVFRLDFAWKVYDPVQTHGDKWVFGTTWRPTTHFAIGYPF